MTERADKREPCPECNGTLKIKILGGEIIDCNCVRGKAEQPSERIEPPKKMVLLDDVTKTIQHSRHGFLTANQAYEFAMKVREKLL